MATDEHDSCMQLTADQLLRQQILRLVGEYHDAAFAPTPFVPGETPVPVSGRVFDAAEMQPLVDASLDFWLTTGRFAAQFEQAVRADSAACASAILVNSGSSANLLALTALTSPKLGDRRLQPGDEVITVAAGFPTTVNPIIQNGLVPVFRRCAVPTYNIDVAQLEAAWSPRTRAIMIAHTLGNPFDLAARHGLRQEARSVADRRLLRCRRRDLSTASKVGTFGDLATVSFYPAHHITMGEGGCVLIDKPLLKTLVESFRDWGRDCWCDPGKDNTCGKRFDWQLGELPCGYDHKYTYSHIGYNLKAHRHAGGGGRGAAAETAGLHRSAAAQFCATAAKAARSARTSSSCPKPRPIPIPAGSVFRSPFVPEPASRATAVIQASRKPPHRYSPVCSAATSLRQPAYRDIPRRVVGDSGKLRFRHEPGLLDRRLSGPDASEGRLHPLSVSHIGKRHVRCAAS